MATSFAATDGLAAHVPGGFAFKIASYKLQLPSSWLAAGIAWDLSDDFTLVYGVLFGGAAQVGSMGSLKGITGTVSGGGFTASTVKILAYRQDGDAGDFVSVADAQDLSAETSHVVMVFGS